MGKPAWNRTREKTLPCRSLLLQCEREEEEIENQRTIPRLTAAQRKLNENHANEPPGIARGFSHI